MHADGLNHHEGGLQTQQLRHLLPRRHLPGARFQHHVRTLRRNDCDVLLPQQAHHDRHWHRQQQQNQLGAQRTSRFNRHLRSDLPGCQERQRTRSGAQGLLPQKPLLISSSHSQYYTHSSARRLNIKLTIILDRLKRQIGQQCLEYHGTVQIISTDNYNRNPLEQIELYKNNHINCPNQSTLNTNYKLQHLQSNLLTTRQPPDHIWFIIFKMISEQKSATNLEISPNYAFDSQLVLTFLCDPEEIIDIFAITAKELEFQLIERQTSYATAVKKIPQPTTLLSFINCCSWWQSDQFTAVKLLLAKQTRKGEMSVQMVAEVKGLVGVQKDIQSFLKLFKHKAEKLDEGGRINKLILGQPEQITSGALQNENPYYLEACSHQIINKLILTDEYTIGEQLEKMISDFKNNFRNIAESASLLPIPVKNIMSIINDISQQLTELLQRLRYPKEILVFSRIQLQNYVFNKLQEQLYAMYRFKNVQVEEKFQQKRQTILQTYTMKEMLVQVCLNKKFWSVNQQLEQSVLPFKQAKQQIYFTVACRELQKMVFTNSPREKIKYCQLAYTSLKNHFYDYSKKKYQLASMEDIIPVLIIVVLFLEVAQLRSELDIMLDFANFETNEMEAEKRLLINLSESYNYIHRDWVLK